MKKIIRFFKLIFEIISAIMEEPPGGYPKLTEEERKSSGIGSTGPR